APWTRASAATSGTSAEASKSIPYGRVVPDRRPLLGTLRQGRYLRLSAVCLLAAAVCCLAGIWQYHRWHGKHATNAELRASAAAAPVPAGDLLAADRPLP